MSFDATWGLVTFAICFALGIPLLWWLLPRRRRFVLGKSIDPRQRLQLGYGLFCIAMAFTNLGCRTIPHGELPLVHPAFFLITLALVAGLGPRVIQLLRYR